MTLASSHSSSTTKRRSVFEQALEELVAGLSDRQDFHDIWQPQESPIGPPHPQVELLNSTCPEIFYGGARGGGKALAHGEPVLTPWGEKPVEGIEVGDAVLNPDGTTARVLGVYPQQPQMIYRVTMDDGCHVDVTDDHLWLARLTGRRLKAERRYLGHVEPLNWKLFTTSQLRERIAVGVRVPLTRAVNTQGTSRHPVEVDPYVVGLMIGDGCLVDSLRFTSADEELQAVAVAQGFRQSGRPIEFFSRQNTPLAEAIRRLGLRGKRSHEKFVPRRYLYGTTEDRLAILQGLLDTDGYADERGHVEFCSVSAALADNVQHLVRSLGGKATLSRHENEHRGAWRLHIRHPRPEELFRLRRKRALCVGKRWNGGHELTRKIVSIEPVEEGAATCIKVDHPNGLFLTRGHIVTHNTDGILGKWLQHRQRWRGMARGVFFRRRQIHLEETIARTHELFPRTGAKWVGSPRQAWIWADGSTLKFRHLWDVKAAGNYQGHAYTFIAFEEVQQWPDPEPLNLLRATLRSAAGVKCLLMATGNPGGVGHQWVKGYYISPAPLGYEKIHDPETGVDRMFIPARLEDNPALTTHDPTYERRLLAASKNPALVRAWRYGDWDVVAGGYFEDVWNKDTQVLEPFTIPDGWWLVRSFDWGSAKPSSLGLWAVSNGESLSQNGGPYPGRTFSPGSFVRIGELYTVERDANGQPLPNTGLRLQNTELGKQIEQVSREVSDSFANGREWDYSYADPSIFDEEGGQSIFEQMREGAEYDTLDFERADNARVPGWQRLRTMLKESCNGHAEGAGLYVFKNCREWLRTFPVLPINERKMDDVDTDAEDHTGDETRYAVQTFSQTTVTSQEVLY